MSEEKVPPPEWFAPFAALTEGTSQLCPAIRTDSAWARLKSNQCHFVTKPAHRHDSSTAPARDMLQIVRRHMVARARAVTVVKAS